MSGEGPRFTAITYNVRSFEGLGADDGRGAKAVAPEDMPERIAAELSRHGPDVVSIQEAQDEALVARAADRLGMEYVYLPGSEAYGGWPTGISGAIMTRCSILRAENLPLASWKERPAELFTRHLGRAVLQAGDGELAIFAAHLHHREARVRMAEIAEILAVMAEDVRAGRSLLVMGDLNHEPESEEYDRWVEAGLTDCFAAGGSGPPLTWPSDGPTQRIDYIWCGGPVAPGLSECRVLSEGAFRAHADAAHRFALSDHLPLMASFLIEPASHTLKGG